MFYVLRVTFCVSLSRRNKRTTDSSDEHGCDGIEEGNYELKMFCVLCAAFCVVRCSNPYSLDSRLSLMCCFCVLCYALRAVLFVKFDVFLSGFISVCYVGRALKNF
jgi:hypothetical protein